MTEWHRKSKRTKTGGMRASIRAEDKKLSSRGGIAANTTIALTKDPKREYHKKRGKTSKVKLKLEKFVYATEGKKVKKLEIVNVEENTADRQFARRNIITKGAVLKVKDGSKEVFVRVTTRPGQQGTLMGVVLEDFKPEKQVKTKKKTEKTTKADSKPKKPETPEKQEKEAK